MSDRAGTRKVPRASADKQHMSCEVPVAKCKEESRTG